MLRDLIAERDALAGRVAELEGALRDAPQQAEPLTDEQIWSSDEIMGVNGTVTQLPMDELRAVVRAVESAHGITSTPSAPTAVERKPL